MMGVSGEPGGVEGGADGFDAAVHHVGGGDDVGSGLGEGGGGAWRGGGRWNRCRSWKWSPSSGDDAAVAVGGVLAEADVGDGDEGVEGAVGLEGAEALLDDALGVLGAGGLLILRLGQAEEEQAAEAEGGAGSRLP